MSTKKLALKTLVISMAAAMATPVLADTKQLPRIDVIGQGEAERETIPAAVNVISKEDIERIQPQSTEDLLRTVPGIYIKREEESAVVTNFGIRGLPAGDFKTLVLEDGVPIQPGIFVGNGRYYNPRVQRMEGVEVLKGAASLRYGPNNIGGVINFLTKTPEDGFAITGKVGSWNTRESTLEIGGSNNSGDAFFGLMYTKAESDGFMNKGYKMDDLMVKVGTAIGDDQMISVKFSQYNNDANISYRGLFEDAYKAGKKFNPAPNDYFLTERTAFDINHEWDVNDNMQLQTLVYWSKMHRGYWRQNATKDTSGDVTVWSYGANNDSAMRGAHREFERHGAETRLSLNHQSFGINNEAQFGLRYFQEELTDLDKTNVPFANRYDVNTSTGTLSRNRVDSANNIAGFVENRFDINEQLSITGGLRLESYETKRVNKNNPNAATETFSDSHFLPGLGATYKLNPMAQVYGSVYQAMSPPSVGNSLTGDKRTEPEKSINTEIGVRGDNGTLYYQVAAFNMDFSNYVEPGVSAVQDPSEGKAIVRGFEAALGYDFGTGFTIDTNLTWVPTAEYRGERATGNSRTAASGNRVAYSPEWLANVTLGYQTDKLATALNVNYTGEVFGNGDNSRDFVESGNWSGLIPSYFTADLTANYNVTKQFNVFGAVKNLTDERYIAGLRQGIYAGPSRSFELGARYKF